MEPNQRILIIDDDPGIREAYQTILQPSNRNDLMDAGAALFGDDAAPAASHESYALTIAEKGEQGLAAVREGLSAALPFAMAFIDMMMPGMDGAETARRIWELDPRIKITIVTAYSEYTPDDIIRVTGRNDLFYLRKPFNPEEIRQFARALTNEWNLEQERERLAGELKAANTRLAEMNRNLEEKVQTQTRMLIQSEKMAAIGILAAGVAHEINNPISYINGNLSVLRGYSEKIVGLLAAYTQLEDLLGTPGTPEICDTLAAVRQFKSREGIDDILADLGDLVDESLEGVDRVRKIVMDMRTFSRVDDDERGPIDINDCLDATLNIIRNEIKYHADVVKAYGDLPAVQGYSQKISQVFMNILINAAKAMDERGTIRIATRFEKRGRRKSDEKVVVTIADTGPGISEENLSKIFDPFFTTKPVGEGTGLGLSISYDIIKAHGGTIQVDSQPGEGATFTIVLPVTSPRPPADKEPPGQPATGPVAKGGEDGP